MAKKPTRRFAMSRRLRNTLIVICALVLTGLACLDKFGGSSVRREISQHAKWGVDGWKYHDKVFTVVNVVDGDTIDIDISDDQHDTTRIRLWGVDTPETGGGSRPSSCWKLTPPSSERRMMPFSPTA